MDDYPASVYYDAKRSGGFGGVDRLYKDVKKEGKFNISRTKIKEWLMKQDTYTLHKPIRSHFRRNRVIVGGIDHQWQMDLADMQPMQKFNDGYRYLLVCIDVFSKYAWVVPLKNKTGLSLVEAFKIILASERAQTREDHHGSRHGIFQQTFQCIVERRRHRIVQHI